MPNASQNFLLPAGPYLEHVGGPSRGEAVDLRAYKTTIGRSDENDVILNGDGVSRNHAIIEERDGAYTIRDNQSKNGLSINGKRVAQASIQDGDLIQIGVYVLRFHAGESLALEEAPKQKAAIGLQAKGKLPSNKRRLYIYGAAGLLLLLLLTQGQEDETKAPAKNESGSTNSPFAAPTPPSTTAMPPSKDSVAGIEDPTMKRAESELDKLDWTNSSLREAEQYFRRGQREYLNKNYHRAIDSFRAALALQRTHKLAYDYLRLSVYEAESEAKAQWDMGVRYFESLQYQRAIYHFSEAMALMSHRPDDPMIKRAEKYIELAKRKTQATELFP